MLLIPNLRLYCYHGLPLALSKRSQSSGAYKDYYSILNVNRRSSPKEIKDSFLKLSKIYHPDNTKSGSHNKFIKLNEAYEVLSDAAKRRVYDSTTRPVQPSSHSYPVGSRPFKDQEHIKRDPISMNHIQHVYKTLNRDDAEETPKFRPFEDHTYPGTDFNRFEFERRWNPDSKAWVYNKKKTSKRYDRQMQEKFSSLSAIVSVLVLALMAGVFSVQYYTRTRSERNQRRPLESNSNSYNSGMYIITTETTDKAPPT